MPLFTAFDAQQLVEKEQERLRAKLNKEFEDELAAVFAVIERAAAQGRSSVRIRGLQNRRISAKGYLESLGYTVASDVISWPVYARVGTAGSPVELAPNELTAFQDVAFETRFFPNGGVGPFTFSLIDGWIPEGLSWGNLTDQMMITLSGTPARTGVGYFTLEIIDQYKTKSVHQVSWTVNAVQEDLVPEYSVDYVQLAADQTQTATSEHTVVTAGLPALVPGQPQTYYGLTLTPTTDLVNGQILGVSILTNAVRLTISAQTVPLVTNQLTQPNTVLRFVYRSQNATWYLI
jgi:hypothetical protein